MNSEELIKRLNEHSELIKKLVTKSEKQQREIAELERQVDVLREDVDYLEVNASVDMEDEMCRREVEILDNRVSDLEGQVF